EVMQESVGSDPARIHLHLGPAICGDCYEVGSEVFEALEQPVPANPAPIDLRAVLAQRAVDAGVAQ
ncbi:MAG TPA: laccase, partial [Gemmatimonadetes bacterium]|nr:laccase [Gemmatimonadota bacterium]